MNVHRYQLAVRRAGIRPVDKVASLSLLRVTGKGDGSVAGNNN